MGDLVDYGGVKLTSTGGMRLTAGDLPIMKQSEGGGMISLVLSIGLPTY